MGARCGLFTGHALRRKSHDNISILARNAAEKRASGHHARASFTRARWPAAAVWRIGGGRRSRTLGAAAALSLGARAGALPARSGTPAIALCRAETRPHFSRRAAALLDACMSGQRELVPQALTWAAQSGQIAPPELLPRLLELGRGSKELRRVLAPILGERGRWLAQLNPDWRAVAAPQGADLEASWQDGELAARRVALRLNR